MTGFADFLASIRRTVEPVEHLTDTEIENSDFPVAVRRLLINLRRSLREYEAADAEARER